MENSIVDKIVEYDKYCKTCQHSTLISNPETGEMPEPCNECLGEPTNVNSKKPIRYKADEGLIAEQAKIDQAASQVSI